MKQILPIALILLLISVLGVCPVLATGRHDSASCCPHSKGAQIPCSDSTGRNCPYVLLEKAKWESGLAGIVLAALPVAVSVELHPDNRFSTPIATQYLADSSDSYLSYRVLRL